MIDVNLRGWTDEIRSAALGDDGYRRTQCDVCQRTLATCHGEEKLIDLKHRHRANCLPPTCGHDDCIDCAMFRQVWTELIPPDQSDWNPWWRR